MLVSESIEDQKVKRDLWMVEMSIRVEMLKTRKTNVELRNDLESRKKPVVFKVQNNTIKEDIKTGVNQMYLGLM